jgi:glutamine synthetase
MCCPTSLAESNPADYASKLKRLPKDLLESVESLAADKTLHELIGDKLITAIIAIRKVRAKYCHSHYKTLYNSQNTSRSIHCFLFVKRKQ